MSLFSPPGAPRLLRPYQVKIIADAREQIGLGKRRLIIQGPTGMGKTKIAAEMTRRFHEQGKRLGFVVADLSLIDQTVAAFEAEGIDDIGVIQGDHPRRNRNAALQICSIQTLDRRGFPDVEIVFVDECHGLYRAIVRWMIGRPEVVFVGMSATPWRPGLGRYYDAMILGPTTQELIDQGYLAQFKVFAPSEPDLKGVREVAGDFHEGELAKRVDTTRVVGDVIEEWRRRAEGLATIVFAVNRLHAQHIEQRFEEGGIACAYLDGDSDRDERKRIFRRFRTGEIKVITNVGVLARGVDLDVRCIVDAAPTKSEMVFVQRIGRGLRVAPDKDHLLILDHAANHIRLGCVTDIHHDTLDDGRERKQGRGEPQERRKPLPRVCEACTFILPAKAVRCPECGALREAKSAIMHRDGELVALGTQAAAWTGPTLAEKIQFFAELLGIARERRYREGWAAHKFRERFGDWPNHPAVRCASPITATLKTRNWIRSRQIAWAKGRAHG